MVLIHNCMPYTVYIAISNFDGKHFHQPVVYELGPNKEFLYETTPQYSFCIISNRDIYLSGTRCSLKKIVVYKSLEIYPEYDLTKYWSITKPQIIKSGPIVDKIIGTMKSHHQYINPNGKIAMYNS